MTALPAMLSPAEQNAYAPRQGRVARACLRWRAPPIDLLEPRRMMLAASPWGSLSRSAPRGSSCNLSFCWTLGVTDRALSRQTAMVSEGWVCVGEAGGWQTLGGNGRVAVATALLLSAGRAAAAFDRRFCLIARILRPTRGESSQTAILRENNVCESHASGLNMSFGQAGNSLKDSGPLGLHTNVLLLAGEHADARTPGLGDLPDNYRWGLPMGPWPSGTNGRTLGWVRTLTCVARQRELDPTHLPRSACQRCHASPTRPIRSPSTVI